MERSGIPIDADTLVAIQDGWEDIKTQLIDEVDSQYGVFDHGHYRDGLFARTYLIKISRGLEPIPAYSRLTITRSLT